MTTDQTLARIDDTLEDWDQWDGHSRDAARWRGRPAEPSPTMQAMAQIAVVLQASIESWTAAMKKVAEVLRRFDLDEPSPKPQRQHTPAAERTRSPRWRAGTRRTKRQARRRL